MASPCGWTRILPQGDSAAPGRRYFLQRVRALRRKQLVLDAVLAAAVFAFSLAAMSRGDKFEGTRDLDLLAGALAALVSWPLLARRVATLPVFALVTAATSALYGLG